MLANAEPRFNGRVMSVYLITFAVSPLATLPMSWLAGRVGTAGAAVLYPQYRRIR